MANIASMFVTLGARVKDFISGFDRAEKKLIEFDKVKSAVKFNAITNGAISAVPAVGALGAAVGGLSSSFAAAGTGAVAFTSVAVSALNDVYKANEDIQKLREKLAATDDLKERKKILQQIADAQSQLSDKQKEGLKALQDFSSFWQNFTKSFQNPVIDIFIKSLDTLKSVLKSLKPAFAGSVKAVSTLMTSLNQSLKAPDVQKFFDFINNRAGPAMVNFGKIFGNIMRGIMNLMVAFGPISADMEGGLLSLSQKFLKWSQTLGQSQGFQTFINYIKTNGPTLLKILQQLGLLFINIVHAAAPIAPVVLSIVKNLLVFINTILSLNPAIGSVIIIIFQMIGVIKLLMPLYSALSAAVKLAMSAKVKAWVTSAISVAKSGLSMMNTMIRVIAKYAWMAVQSAINAAKIAATWTVTMVKAAAQGAAAMMGTMVRVIAKYAWMAAQALVQAARFAASWVIAMGPVGWVIGVIVALVALIIAKWNTVKKWTSSIWSAVWGAIKHFVGSIWDKIKSVWDSIVRFLKSINLYSIGKNIIEGLVNGVVSMGKSLISKVKHVVSGAIEAAKNFLGIHSPSKVFMEIGQYTGKGYEIGIAQMGKKINQTVTHVLTPPKLDYAAMPGMGGGGSSTHVTHQNIINVSQLVVREEADIRKISEQLYDLQRRKSRASGVN